MTTAFKRTDRAPVTQGETRRKLLLHLKAFGRAQPGVPSYYLITENNEPIVFGEDRILIKKVNRT